MKEVDWMQMGTWSDYLQDQTTAVDPVSELNPGTNTGPISTVYILLLNPFFFQKDLVKVK